MIPPFQKDHKTQDTFLLREFRKLHPKPYFDFVNLPDSERLTYELLSHSNCDEVPRMFEEENNPFVIEDYKNRAKFTSYTNYHLNYNRFSPKHGGCDWLFKLKDTAEYLGILNVYDLSLETFNNNHLKCTIGFNIVEIFRRKKLTAEAVRQLLEYITNHLKREKIIAYTNRNNASTIAFLAYMGFIKSTEYPTNNPYSFFEWIIQQ